MNSDQHIVIDVPERLTPEEAAQLLNAPGDSYFLVQVLPIAAGHRAYLRRYKEKPPTKAELAKEQVSDATAMSILRANRGESVRDIVGLLKKAGIKRGKEWVCNQLDATCAEDGKEERARECVEKTCLFYNEPKDIVEELKSENIKRSIGWARRTQEELRKASGWTPEKQKENDDAFEAKMVAIRAKYGLSVRKVNS